jgi:hypothetical protein
MEQPTSKFYYASVMAVRDSPDAANKQEAHQLPTVIGPLTDIANAKTVACEYALRQFPFADGWREHNAVVVPATNEVMNLLKTTQFLLTQGVVVADDPAEQGERFFCGLTPTQTSVTESDLDQ